MADKTSIEWTDSTLNFWRGCHWKSPGCDNCYMKRFVDRPSVVQRTSPTIWEKPLKWRKPRKVFVCSLSDFFIKEADAWRPEAWDIIRRCPQHTFQILTKRPERIAGHLPDDWDSGYRNVWLGVSIENQEMADRRIPLLIDIPAVVHFLSVEPMLGPVSIDGWESFGGDEIYIDWVIIGGESGPGARAMQPEWVRSLRISCEWRGIPFFFKQWGGVTRINGHWGGNELDGRTYLEFPQVEPYRPPEQLELF